MNKYTVRVELFDTKFDNDEYDKLHFAMAKNGFKRTILDEESKIEYHLPPAEYSYIGKEDIDTISTLAMNAAKSTGHKYSLLITQSGGIRFYNLKEVKKLKAN